MNAQTSNATIPCTAHGARVIWWKATNSTKMSFRPFWFLCLCSAVAWLIRFFICHPFVFQQLKETFSIFCSNEITIFALDFTATSVCLVRQCFIEFRHLFWHHQISMRIIMEIVLLQCIQRFSDATNARRLIKYTLLISIFNTNRFTGCHFSDNSVLRLQFEIFCSTMCYGYFNDFDGEVSIAWDCCWCRRWWWWWW